MQTLPTEPSGWHLKKEIQLGHLITTLTVMISAVLYVGKVEQRVAVLESAAAAQHERDERQDRASAEERQVIRSQLDKINDKLDRLVEGRRK